MVDATEFMQDTTVLCSLTLGLLMTTSLYLIVFAIYNLYFHPLARFNGPTFWCISRLGYLNSMLRGNLVADVKHLHEKYGDIVRLAPNELSFAREDAWYDIYAKRAGHKTFQKNPMFYKAPLDQPENLVTTTCVADHSRMRKVLEPAFTEPAMMRQEAVICSYVDLLVQKLKTVVGEPQNSGVEAVVNIVNWYNFYTFDTIGDLCVGEGFGSLERTDYHPWVSSIFTYIKGMTFLAATRFYPFLELVLLKILPSSIKKMQEDHYQVALDKIHRRLNLKEEREDLMTPVLKNNIKFEKMSLEEVESTFSLLIIAGSETTATVLSGITNELVKAPAELQKLVREVRNSFLNESEITLSSLKRLPFLNAVCHEGLRLCNAVPGGMPRLVPKGDDTVCGQFLPSGTCVSVSPTALSYSSTHFFLPERFIPERFLPDPLRPTEFAADQRSSQQPFGLGPRSCIGRRLAWAQLRMVLAKMVWHFDMKAVPGKTVNWMKQKTFFVVQKEPLEVALRMRRVDE